MAQFTVRKSVRVNVAGTIRSNGETFTADPEDVQHLVARGWVTPAEKAVKAESVEDKATPRKRTPRKRV